MPRLGYWTLAVFSLLIALGSLRVFFLPFDEAMPNMGHFITEAPWRLWAHILAGPVALALAVVQLSSNIRARWPSVHRWSGRVYGVAVLAAGLAGLTLAPTSETSEFSRAGFMVLAALWIATTWIGIFHAMRGNYTHHRWWMERSLALTFAAVTLRIIMAPLLASGWTVGETYNVTAWGSWLLNLAVLEWWQRRQVVRLA